jgi:O-methyltransferase involved in polyketide biosynthesis
MTRRAPRRSSDERADLAITAFYTAHAWHWGQLDQADLFTSRRTRDVFNATNLVLGAARVVRRLPSLRHGLVQRHVMLDHLCAASGCAQVLELAAGLSRRGASRSADPRVRYVEVDLPPMIAEKQRLLARTERGRAVLARENLVLVPGDAATLDLASVLAPGPVFVIAEGLFMYLDAAAQRALWGRIAALVAARPGSALAFDLLPTAEEPPPGVVGRALEGMLKRFTRGRTFAKDVRTRDDLAGDLRAAGFARVDALEPAAAPAAWQLPFLGERTRILVWHAR